MSHHTAALKDLIRTLEDGKEGFSQGAEKLAETDRPDLAATFREYSQQRAQFSGELRQIATTHDEDVSDNGTVAGAMHRGWMAVKDAIAGSDPGGVLDAAEQGEDHAVNEYKKALEADLPTDAQTIVQRQYTAVKAAHDEIRALRNTLS